MQIIWQFSSVVLPPLCQGVAKADCKHVKIVLEIRKNKSHKDSEFSIMERSKLSLCKYCDSGNLKKDGMRQTRKGSVQRFKCLDCGKRFTANFGFEKMRHGEEVITGALQMYFAGMSTRDIADHYEMLGISVDDSTVCDWICKYSEMAEDYLNWIVSRVGDWVRVDEIVVKVAGKRPYVFASMDDDTRYWIAQEMSETKFQHNADNLLRMTKGQTYKTPRSSRPTGFQHMRGRQKRCSGRGRCTSGTSTLQAEGIGTTTRWRG